MTGDKQRAVIDFYRRQGFVEIARFGLDEEPGLPLPTGAEVCSAWSRSHKPEGPKRRRL